MKLVTFVNFKFLFFPVCSEDFEAINEKCNLFFRRQKPEPNSDLGLEGAKAAKKGGIALKREGTYIL